MFRVPEESRITVGTLASPPAVLYGAFMLPSPESGWWLFCIACDAEGHPDVPGSVDWEHVSVSARSARQRRTRTPSWREMAFIKDVFWQDEDVVVQFHPRRSEYVNQHPNVLHLWRYMRAAFPTPASHLVGQL